MKEKNKLFAYFKPYWGLALLAPLLMIGRSDYGLDSAAADESDY